LFPWVFGNLFSLKTSLHLPIFENPPLILVMGILGSLGGIYIGGFKFSHSTHVFLSVFASFFYLLAFSVTINIWAIIVTSIIVFLVVFIPCCVSDIIFPILFIKKPCEECRHWHG
jgi:fatty acid desaturase